MSGATMAWAETVAVDRPERYILSHDGYFIAKDREGYPVHVSFSDQAFTFRTVEAAEEFNRAFGSKFRIEQEVD